MVFMPGSKPWFSRYIRKKLTALTKNSGPIAVASDVGRSRTTDEDMLDGEMVQVIKGINARRELVVYDGVYLMDAILTPAAANKLDMDEDDVGITTRNLLGHIITPTSVTLLALRESARLILVVHNVDVCVNMNRQRPIRVPPFIYADMHVAQLARAYVARELARFPTASGIAKQVGQRKIHPGLSRKNKKLLHLPFGTYLDDRSSVCAHINNVDVEVEQHGQQQQNEREEDDDDGGAGDDRTNDVSMDSGDNDDDDDNDDIELEPLANCATAQIASSSRFIGSDGDNDTADDNKDEDENAQANDTPRENGSEFVSVLPGQELDEQEQDGDSDSDDDKFKTEIDIFEEKNEEKKEGKKEEKKEEKKEGKKEEKKEGKKEIVKIKQEFISRQDDRDVEFMTQRDSDNDSVELMELEVDEVSAIKLEEVKHEVADDTQQTASDQERDNENHMNMDDVLPQTQHMMTFDEDDDDIDIDDDDMDEVNVVPEQPKAILEGPVPMKKRRPTLQRSSICLLPPSSTRTDKERNKDSEQKAVEKSATIEADLVPSPPPKTATQTPAKESEIQTSFCDKVLQSKTAAPAPAKESEMPTTCGDKVSPPKKGAPAPAKDSEMPAKCCSKVPPPKKAAPVPAKGSEMHTTCCEKVPPPDSELDEHVDIVKTQDERELDQNSAEQEAQKETQKEVLPVEQQDKTQDQRQEERQQGKQLDRRLDERQQGAQRPVQTCGQASDPKVGIEKLKHAEDCAKEKEAAAPNGQPSESCATQAVQTTEQGAKEPGKHDGTATADSHKEDNEVSVVDGDGDTEMAKELTPEKSERPKRSRELSAPPQDMENTDAQKASIEANEPNFSKTADVDMANGDGSATKRSKPRRKSLHLKDHPPRSLSRLHELVNYMNFTIYHPSNDPLAPRVHFQSSPTHTYRPTSSATKSHINTPRARTKRRRQPTATTMPTTDDEPVDGTDRNQATTTTNPKPNSNATAKATAKRKGAQTGCAHNMPPVPNEQRTEAMKRRWMEKTSTEPNVQQALEKLGEEMSLLKQVRQSMEKDSAKFVIIPEHFLPEDVDVPASKVAQGINDVHGELPTVQVTQKQKQTENQSQQDDDQEMEAADADVEVEEIEAVNENEQENDAQTAADGEDDSLKDPSGTAAKAKVDAKATNPVAMAQ